MNKSCSFCLYFSYTTRQTCHTEDFIFSYFVCQDFCIFNFLTFFISLSSDNWKSIYKRETDALSLLKVHFIFFLPSAELCGRKQ